MKTGKMRDYINQKSDCIKDVLIKGVATALTAGAIFTVAGCANINNNPDDTTTNKSEETTNLETSNPFGITSPFKSPENFYEDNQEFTKVDFPKSFEECSGVEKIDTFIKNYLKDETAQVEYLLLRRDFDEELNPFARMTLISSSQKNEEAEEIYVKSEFSLGGQEIIDKHMLTEDSYFSLSRKNEGEIFENACGEIYGDVAAAFDGKTYKDNKEFNIGGKYTDQITKYFQNDLKGICENFITSSFSFIMMGDNRPDDNHALSITPNDDYYFRTNPYMNNSIECVTQGGKGKFYDLNTKQLIENFLKENHVVADGNRYVISRSQDPELYEKFCELFMTQILTQE